MNTLRTAEAPLSAGDSYSAALASPVEALLARVWVEILDVTPVSREADFLVLSARDPFDLSTLVSRLRLLGFDIDPSTVLAHPRMQDLAALLAQRHADPDSLFVAMPIDSSQPAGSMPPIVPAGLLAVDPAVVEAACPDAGPSFIDATLPFRFTWDREPESSANVLVNAGANADPSASAPVSRVTLRSRRVDAAMAARAFALFANEAGAADPATVWHLALALALARCSGRPAVSFATVAGTTWQPLAIDFIGCSLATAAATVRDRLAGPRCRGQSGGDQPPAQAVALRISSAASPTTRSSASPAASAVPGACEASAAWPVVIDVVGAAHGWELSIAGRPTAQPERLLDYLVQALGCLADARAADVRAPALSLDVMPPAERRRLDAFATGPVCAGRGGPAIGPWFERQARATPDAIALVAGKIRLTYHQLDERANRLGAWLRLHGAGRGSRVGICLARGVDMVVTQLAILKLGAAYVPLDPSFPRDRLAFMADDAGLALLVSETTSNEALPWPAERTVLLDRDRQAIEARRDIGSSLASEAGIEADDPAYVIYTSGSTGKPKGVVVTNGNVTNFIAAIQDRPGIGPADRLLAVTTLSFDIHVLELLAPLCTGACIVLADATEASSGLSLQDLIAHHQVTMLQATPSTWNLLIDAGWVGTPGLTALIGGEALSRELANQLLVRTAALWNMYGPTEATVWSHCWRVNEPANEIAIGTPLANLTGRVVDPAGRPCPIGVAGELWIGGVGVAAGYWHRDDLTRERFIRDPFNGKTIGKTAGMAIGNVNGRLSDEERIYRTGDLVVCLDQGDLRHLGRMDQQVKVRGHRIELGEIEAAIEANPAVAECVCAVRTDPGGEARIVAYARCREALDVLALLADVGRTLPDYMVPQHVVTLASLPLLPNGKVDRKSLPEPAWSVHARIDAPTEAPETAVETALAAIWAEVLKIDRIGRHDDFFDLGGHSLTAMRVLTRIEKTFGRRLRVASLFEAPTLQGQAQLIERLALPEATSASAVVPIQAGGTRPPIFFVSGYGGPILLLQKLARELGPDQPLLLLDFAALTGAGESDTIEAAARALVAHMRIRQPEGPYHLAGYSLGAPIVYEMGQQLMAAGQSVPMLAMLDRFAPGHPPSPSFSRRVLLHLREATRRGPRGAAGYLGFFTTRLLRRLARGIGLPVAAHQPGENVEVATLNLDSATIGLGKASDHYVFKLYAGPLMFIRVADLSDRAIGTVEPDPFGGWHELAPMARAIGVVPGTHTTLLFPENSRHVAGLLIRCMEIARNDAEAPRANWDSGEANLETSRSIDFVD